MIVETESSHIRCDNPGDVDWYYRTFLGNKIAYLAACVAVGRVTRPMGFVRMTREDGELVVETPITISLVPTGLLEAAELLAKLSPLVDSETEAEKFSRVHCSLRVALGLGLC
jgi:hypothetical protein